VPRRQRRIRALLAVVLLAIVLAVDPGEGSSGDSTRRDTAPTAQAAKQKEPGLVLGRRVVPGDRGPAVRKLQLALIELGMDPGKPDGLYGDRTAGAVAAFKTSRGLTADGVVDKRTVREINRVLAELDDGNP
jgi:peptidoglycan hydrolase-like protein with peptidoglycan-binding domain